VQGVVWKSFDNTVLKAWLCLTIVHSAFGRDRHSHSNSPLVVGNLMMQPASAHNCAKAPLKAYRLTAKSSSNGSSRNVSIICSNFVWDTPTAANRRNLARWGSMVGASKLPCKPNNCGCEAVSGTRQRERWKDR